MFTWDDVIGMGIALAVALFCFTVLPAWWDRRQARIASSQVKSVPQQTATMAPVVASSLCRTSLLTHRAMLDRRVHRARMRPNPPNRTAEPNRRTPEPTQTQRDIIREMADRGFSQKKIAQMLGGTYDTRIKQVRAILSPPAVKQNDAADEVTTAALLAQERAKPGMVVPEYAPPTLELEHAA